MSKTPKSKGTLTASSKAKTRKWLPVATVAQLSDGRTVPAIDDGMFIKPKDVPTPPKLVSNTEEIRAAVGDVFGLVFQTLDEIEKDVRGRLDREPEEFSECMGTSARELLAVIVSAKRLIHEKEWQLVAPYLLSIGRRWESLRIELGYRDAIIGKRRIEEGARQPRGISNPDLLEFLEKKPNGLSMRPSEAVRFMRLEHAKEGKILGEFLILKPDGMMMGPHDAERFMRLKYEKKANGLQLWDEQRGHFSKAFAKRRTKVDAWEGRKRAFLEAFSRAKKNTR